MLKRLVEALLTEAFGTILLIAMFVALLFILPQFSGGLLRNLIIGFLFVSGGVLALIVGSVIIARLTR